jgi:hypothetical protein
LDQIISHVGMHFPGGWLPCNSAFSTCSWLFLMARCLWPVKHFN